MISRVYRIFFLVTLITSSAFAQQTGILKGVVYDFETHEILPGATIQLSGNMAKGAATDADGHYMLELDTGYHQLICSFISLKTYTFSVHISTNIVTENDIYLKPVAKSLETIVVSSGKFDQRIEDITVSMEILKPKLISAKNTTSIETALEQVPGLSIIDNDPQIRGGSGFTFGVGSRVAILSDGIPLLSGDAGRPEWSYIPVENIEQVEVIKGASSVLYGSSALNGVINIRTAYPRSKPKTVISVSSGEYSLPQSPADQTNWYNKSIPGLANINFLHSRIVKDNLDIVVGGNFNMDQGYVQAPPPAIYLPPDIKSAFNITANDSIHTFKNSDMLKIRGRVNFNIRYRSKKTQGLNYGINGNGMLNKTNMVLAWLNDSNNINKGYPGAVFLERQSLFNIDPFIKYSTASGISHSLITRIFHTDNQISGNQSNNGTNYFAEYQLQRAFKGLGLTFTGGLVNNLSYSYSKLYASSGTPHNTIQNRAGYVQLDYKLWKIINLSGGFRYEYFKMNSQQSVVAPIFRGGGNIQLFKSTFLRVSGGQGFRYPTITERFITTKAGMFAVFPNPDLKPETSVSYEAGLKQGFKIGNFRGFLDAAVFSQNYKNTIEFLFGEWDPSIAIAGFKFINTGNSRVNGLDLSMSASTVETNKNFGVTTLIGYTYVDPVSTTPNYVYAQYVPIGGDPNKPTQLSYNSTSLNSAGNVMKYRYKHMAKADIEFKIFKFNVGASYRYYSKMQNIDKAFQDLETLTNNPFFYQIKATNFWNTHNGFNIFDARLSYKINPKQKISLVCNNVFNVTYMLRPMKLEAPRTTMVQYMYEF
jgi:outer membrane receptor protein involved in Fe transport